MSAIQGISSPLADPESGVIPGPEWFDALDNLRPGRPLAIRCSIGANAANVVNIDAYKRGIAAYTARGHDLHLVLEASLWRAHEQHGARHDATMQPNAVLAPLGECAANRWTDGYSLRCCDTLRRLGPDCPATVIIANETNILAPLLQMGQPIPPNKPEALSKEVAAAMTWLAATRIRALCPAVKELWPAALSVLVKFNTDPKGEWVAGRVAAEVAYLTSLGLHPPFPWNNLLVNTEGPVPKHYADVLFFELAQVKGRTGITGGSVVSEWGAPAGGLTPDTMTTAFHALDTYASHMFFFQAGMKEPNNATTYGAWQWTVRDGYLVPTLPTAWVPLLRKLYTEASPPLKEAAC